MESRNKFREYILKGNTKLLDKLLNDLSSRSATVIVNEPVDKDGTTPIILCARACKEEKDVQVELYEEGCSCLIKHGAKVNDQSEDGKTALHWAVLCPTEAITRLLLAAKADPTILDKTGINPLQTAIKEDYADNVKLLVEHAPKLANERDEFGVPPVILALQHGHGDIVRHLVEAGADVNIQEARTLRTPLHYALYTKKLKIFEFLLGHKPDLTKTDHRGTTIVHRASAIRDKSYLDSLVRLTKSPPTSLWTMADDEGYTAVMLACQNDCMDQLHILLEQGATVSDHDKCGRTALHHCVENPETACADILLKKDTSLLNTSDNEGLTPLHMSAITGNVDLLRLLLKKGANLTCRDQEGHTVVHWATVSGHTECLEILVEHGADLSSADNHQASPVHYAAQIAKGSASPAGGSKEEGTQVLRLLLHHKISHNTVDKDGRQPLLWAASAGNPGACQVLVEAGANVNATDNDGLTALHCAASRGHTSCIDTLITKCKANVDVVDKNNCTPLFYAITLGNLDCMRTLIQHGANTAHTDGKGRSPAHCVALKGSREALEILQKTNTDFWLPSEHGNYPLHEATHGGHEDIVKFLLGLRPRKEVVDLANEDGRTSLHIAALINSLSICKLLLDAGANVNAVMKNKGKYYTPTDAAVLKGHKETGDYLVSKGGRKGNSVTNDAAIIIQRNYKLRALLRPTTPKIRVKSPKRREFNRLEELSPEKGEDRPQEEKVVLESESNVKDSDSNTAQVAVSVSLQAQRKKTPQGDFENEVKNNKSETKGSPQKDANTKTKSKESDKVKETNKDKNKSKVKPERLPATEVHVKEVDNSKKANASAAPEVKQTVPKKGILKTYKDNKENTEPMGSNPSKQNKAKQETQEKYKEPEEAVVNGERDERGDRGEGEVKCNDSVDSGEFYRSHLDGRYTESRSRSRMSKANKTIVGDVQASVRRYEEERKAVREYHQLRRAQIYTGPLYDIALYTKNLHGHHDSLDTQDGEKNEKRQSFNSLSQWSDHVNGELDYVDDPARTKSAKAHKAKIKTDLNSARQSTAKKCKRIGQKAKNDEDQQDAERKQHEKEVEMLASNTEKLFADLDNRASTSVQAARDTNTRLRSSLDCENDRKQTLQNGYTEKETRRSRREKQKEERKRKSEEFQRLLRKAYQPDTVLYEQLTVSREKSSLRSSNGTPVGLNRTKTMMSAHSTPSPTSRPVSMYSKRSATSSSVNHSRPKRQTTTIMTAYGSRKITTNGTVGVSASYPSPTIDTTNYEQRSRQPRPVPRQPQKESAV